MPIRPENAARYPKDWPAISQRIRKRARDHCEECGVSNYAIGGRTPDGKWCAALPLGCNGKMPGLGSWDWCEGGQMLRIVRVVLTVAHLDHTPENCADENLKALCQRCHNRYDAATRRAGMKDRAKAALRVPDLLSVGMGEG